MTQRLIVVEICAPAPLVGWQPEASALRLYILFIGPADARADWQETGLEGISRFLRRLWRVALEVTAHPDGAPAERALAHKAHETIVKVTDDLGRRYAYNTAIAAVMELVNEVARDPAAPGARFAVETAVSLIQPAAPHIAEELWEQLGHSRLWEQTWPVADPALLQRETFELVVQVNGTGTRPATGAGRPVRGRAGRAREGSAEGAELPKQRRDPADDRCAAQARQPRRRLIARPTQRPRRGVVARDTTPTHTYHTGSAERQPVRAAHSRFANREMPAVARNSGS
jgi:Anticodon-binding domain of tRNA ligase